MSIRPSEGRHIYLKALRPEKFERAKKGSIGIDYGDNDLLPEAKHDMSYPTPKSDEFKVAETAIHKIGSHLWFSDLTPEWQKFLVSNAVGIFEQYEVTMDQAARKVIEFYVEIVQAYPEAKTMNPWVENLPIEG